MLSRNRTSLLDELGMREREQVATELLAEMLKLLRLAKDEFKIDVRKATEVIENFVDVIDHLDIHKKGKDQAVSYLLKLGESIRIASIGGVPRGFVHDMTIPKIKYETTLLQIISVFKRADSKIFHDLGVKLMKSEKKYLEQLESKQARDANNSSTII